MRLGIERVVLDAPWGLACRAISNVWPEPDAPGGWTRYAWPFDERYGLFVAPIDLRVGHAIEAIIDEGGTVIYGWIADANDRQFVLVPAVDAAHAVNAAQHAYDIWHATEIADVTNAWRDRVDSFRDSRKRDM